ncbi:MAG: trigger factor, partial [Chloracidobacterium sp.]
CREQVLGEPRIQDIRLTDQLPFVIKVEVDVFPEFKVGSLEGLEGVKRVVPVTDADVDRLLEKFRASLATTAPIEDGRPAQPGDIVTVSLVGYLLEEGATMPADGQAPSLTQREEVLELGSKLIREEFDQALRGKTVGEHVVVDVEYPSGAAGTTPASAPMSAGGPDLAGKRVQFHLKVERLAQRTLPALDDTFAQQFGGLTSLEELRARLRAEMEADMERRAMEALDTQLLDQLVQRTGVEAPPYLVTEQVNRRLGDFVEQLEQQGIDPRKANYDFQKMGEALRPGAEAEIKRVVVLEQVAREADLHVSEEEVADYLASLAAQANLAPEVLRARLTRENRLDSVRATLRNRKAMVIVRSAARIETQTVLPEDVPAPEETVSFPSENQ